MAKSNLEKRIGNEHLKTDHKSVITGDQNPDRFLLYQLKLSLEQAKDIDIIVSFLMESGVRLIINDLKSAINRGARVRILTGDYLGITQPAALYLIKNELGDKVDLRFYADKYKSFHPKAYIFHYEDKNEIYIGSSNVSRSALTSGVEWNYRFCDQSDKTSYDKFYDTFEDLFFNHSVVINDEELKAYSKNWHKPAVMKDIEKYHESRENKEPSVVNLFQPRGVQIEALYALKSSRDEGADKGLVHAATGVGKTYLAAFDSASFKRVLFVAHREEILKQAATAFKNVRKSDDYGFFFNKEKATDKAVIFASVATLGRVEYLNEKFFKPDYFDYIVIDEFHHAVTKQYRQIIEYFKPKFLLGLTATPERMDGRDIYEICDYNVPYEISLKDAINKGVLVPFHYYGIFDETDYSNLRRINGHYDERELTEIYKNNQYRYELIYKHYIKHRSKRALGFCCSRLHAEKMAEAFSERGIPALAVYSNGEGEYSEKRDKAIERLNKGDVSVIFSVDMFNEGLDIASLDMVMFLRPTESPVVFLQQLGRGLRTYKGKRYLTVLDFIGNYEKAGRVSFLLSGQDVEKGREGWTLAETDYPDDCQVDFDMRLVDLFNEMDKKSLSIREKILGEYYLVKEKLGGRVPTRMELFTYMEGDIYQLCVSHAKEDPFRKYLDFLKSIGDLSEKENEMYNGLGRDFLNVIETTNMQKVYKMPVLYSFYNDGEVRLAVTDEELLSSWKDFFNRGTNWKDFDPDMTIEKYKNISDKEHLRKAKNMPIKYLIQSGKGFFVNKEGYAIALKDELKAYIVVPEFSKHMGDILEYRSMEYYRRRYLK